MGLSDSTFFLCHVRLIGSAATGKTLEQINYKVVAYVPGYTGKLTAFSTLPYREKIGGHLLGTLKQVTWGKNSSTFPNENPVPQSPFPSGVTFRFLIDGTLAEKDPETATLVGFGQASDSSGTWNLSVYHVAKKDQKIVTLADNLEVYLQQVCTNKNLPQSWAS